MTQVWKSSLPHPLKSVLLSIADHANDDGTGCYAGEDRHAYKVGYTRRQIVRIIKTLSDQGIIVYAGKSDVGTKTWDIVLDKIPILPPFTVWLKETRAKEFNPSKKAPKTGQDKMSYAIGQNVLSDRTSDALNMSQMSYYPSAQPSVNNHQIHTAVPAKVSAPVPSNGVHHDEDDEWSRRVPANERENIDDQITRGDDDLDDKAKMRPKTELEKKIVQLCKSSYITDNQRRRLSENVFAAQGKQRPQNYPSPEAEWKENPDRFNAYVEDCARIQRNNTSRPPGRDALIGLIRNYARHKTGWLDFKDFKEVEAAPDKQAEGTYYENRPKRPVFGEKPRP